MTAAWAAVIFLVSSIPELPDTGLELPGLDRVAHFAEYLVLGLLLCRSCAVQDGPWARHAGILAVAAAVVYGALDELHQGLVPGRSAELGDLLADVCGAVAAALVWAATKRKRRCGVLVEERK